MSISIVWICSYFLYIISSCSNGPNLYDCTSGICAQESIQLLKQFYARGNPHGIKNKNNV
jgi:hypothetical protein